MLKKGEVDFAVCTIDAYILNGKGAGYPGTIISVIDESKGGDAIVAWKKKVPSIQKLTTMTGYRIAFTPASPSEHLLKAIAVDFDIDFAITLHQFHLGKTPRCQAHEQQHNGCVTNHNNLSFC